MTYTDIGFLYFYYKKNTQNKINSTLIFITKNKKYALAETTGYLSGIAGAYFTMIGIDNLNIDIDYKIIASSLGKTAGWFTGNAIGFKIYENFEDKNNHINLKSLLKTNTTTTILAFGLKYGICKYLIEAGLEPEISAGITASVSGAIPTTIRHILNAKNDILKLKEKKSKPNLEKIIKTN